MGRGGVTIMTFDKSYNSCYYSYMIDTINISLPSQLKIESEKLVKQGQYASFSDLVRTALRKIIEETNYNQLAEQAKKEYFQGKSNNLKNSKDIEQYFNQF